MKSKLLIWFLAFKLEKESFFCDFSQANIFTGRIYGKIGGCYPKKGGGGASISGFCFNSFRYNYTLPTINNITKLMCTATIAVTCVQTPLRSNEGRRKQFKQFFLSLSVDCIQP